MKKTYITTMPDHMGAFLKASECFKELGINITRVSYNKAIDSHTLFIDAEGEETKLKEADVRLTEIGYLNATRNGESIALLEFLLEDKPGGVTDILRLIKNYNLNISYISSQENGSGYQAFKMGLFVENEEKLKCFFAEAENLCPVKVIEYNRSEKVYDNSIFYQTFVSGLINSMELSESKRNELTVYANMVMQMLDEKGLSPYKTFESISRFATLLAKYRRDAFKPRITRHKITDNTEIILIEPPCGSNTAIVISADEILFVDSGYALYKDEMIKVFRALIPDYDNMKKRIFVTHADVDHCGLLPLFDEIIASRKTKECLTLEYKGLNGYREQNPLHKPYVGMCKALTLYNPADPEKINAMWDAPDNQTEPLMRVGYFDSGELHFEAYHGQGGHLKGEMLLIDREHQIVFSGDVYINVHGLTAEQEQYNQYAPVLMTSVDTDPVVCAAERQALMRQLGAGEWQIFGAHGMKKTIQIT